jgi:hypothetical protein
MKKILSFLLCAVLLTVFLSADETYDARKLKWGMSAEEVKGIENIQNSYVSVSGSLVLYKKAKLFDNDIIIKFCFDADNRLRVVEYESLTINFDYNEKFLEAIERKVSFDNFKFILGFAGCLYHRVFIDPAISSPDFWKNAGDALAMFKEKYGDKEGMKEENEKSETADEEITEEHNTTLNYLKLLRNKRYLYKYPGEALKYVKEDRRVELKASDDYDLRKNLIKAKIWQYNNTVLLYNSIQGNSSILVVQYIDKDSWEKAKQEFENLVDVELKKIAAGKAEPAEESEEML